MDILNVPADHMIISTRVFKVDVEQMFRAWTEPEHLKEWWGPKGFTNTFHEFDLREGGTWKFTMHGPEKGNYENEVVFLNINEPNFIAWNRITQPYFKVAASFEKEAENKTKVIFRMIFDSKEECDKLKKFVVDKNEENFDKLEIVLGRMSNV